MAAQPFYRSIDELSTRDLYQRSDTAGDDLCIVLDDKWGYVHEFAFGEHDAQGFPAADRFTPTGTHTRILIAYGNAKQIAHVQHHPARAQWVAALTTGKPVSPVHLAEQMFGIGVSVDVVSIRCLAPASLEQREAWAQARRQRAQRLGIDA